MTQLTKIEAQQRVDRVRSFQTELDLLEQEEILHLTEKQHQSIDKYHTGLLSEYVRAFDIDSTHKAKQLSLGLRIASFLGALALAASVFFLFYQFWGQLSTAVQIGILIASPIITYIAAIVVSRHERGGYFAKLLAMVSFACFVLNLSMLGQIFNITPSDKAFLLWSALAFLLAYTCDARLLLAAGILSLTAFIAARTGTWSGMYWLSFGERPENFFPAAAGLFLIPLVIDQHRCGGFAMTYRVFALLCLFLPMLVLANWGYGSYLHLDADIIEGIYQVAGFVLSVTAIWFGARRGWNDVVNTGNVFFVIFLYTKLFDWWWDVMPKYLFFLIIALTSILFILIFKRLRGRLSIHSEGVQA